MTVAVPEEVCVDAFVVHIQESPIFRSKLSSWGRILYSYYLSPAFRELHAVTVGDPALSRLAAVRLLNSLLRLSDPQELRRRAKGRSAILSTLADEIERQRRRSPEAQRQEGDAETERRQRGSPGTQMHEGGEQGQEEGGEGLALTAALDSLDPRMRSAAITAVSSLMAEDMQEFTKAVQICMAVSKASKGGRGWSHEGLPVLELLERPDITRKLVASRLVLDLTSTLPLARRLLAQAGRFSKGASAPLGLPVGVRRMMAMRDVVRMVPQEFAADDEILAYRLASRTAMVYDQHLPEPRTIIYIDKSGSMSGEMHVIFPSGERRELAKVSVAAAVALSALQCGMLEELRPFDTEVHQPVRGAAEMLQFLLTVEADGGTSITNVFQDAMELTRRGSRRFVVVTDGIDEVDPEVARRAAALRAIEIVMIQTSNSLLQSLFPCYRMTEPLDLRRLMRIVVGR